MSQPQTILFPFFAQACRRGDSEVHFQVWSNASPHYLRGSVSVTDNAVLTKLAAACAKSATYSRAGSDTPYVPVFGTPETGIRFLDVDGTEVSLCVFADLNAAISGNLSLQ